MFATAFARSGTPDPVEMIAAAVGAAVMISAAEVIAALSIPQVFATASALYAAPETTALNFSKSLIFAEMKSFFSFPALRIAFAIPLTNATSVPGLIWTKRSAYFAVGLFSELATMTFAPLLRAMMIRRPASGLSSSGFVPTTRIAFASAISGIELVIAP